MRKLTLDIETFSRADLKKAGMAKYAADESTDILCACWAFDDGPVSAWIPSADNDFCRELMTRMETAGEPLFAGIYCGDDPPAELCGHIADMGELHAWNAAFERTVLGGPAGRRYGIPKIAIKQTRCSMANARVHGLPGALEDAANAVDAPVKKRVSGLNAMRYLCKPRKDGTRPTIVEERERFFQLVPYCGDDVRSERAVDAIVPAMPQSEIEVYYIDQEMNDRGVAVDLEAVDAMEILLAEYKKQLKLTCKKETGFSPTQTGELAEWIRKNGYPQLENLQADTIRKALLTDIPDNVKRILRLYSTHNMKSVEKFKAMRNAAMEDGRIRHMFLFYGANTGRWSSLIVQLQNLFRPVIDDPEVAIEICKEWDLDYLRSMYPGVDPMKVMASCVRSCLVAAPGNELIFPDYSGVEARWNAWMFNEAWKIQLYLDGADLYKATIARAYNLPLSEVNSLMRQLGKVLELSMGYEGGVGAFVKMAGTYRVDLKDMAARTILPPEIAEEASYNYAMAMAPGGRGDYGLPEKIWVTCEGLKLMWRRAHPRIVKGWEHLREAAISAVMNPEQAYSIPNGRVKFKTFKDWLVMQLPSGRKLWYYKPEVRGETLHYFGINTVTRQWGTTHTYGGKICENETQAGCRDLLVAAKRRLVAAGLPMLGSVHDQPILECAYGAVDEDKVTPMMCTLPAWAEGMPLAIEYHHGPRFKK